MATGNKIISQSNYDNAVKAAEAAAAAYYNDTDDGFLMSDAEYDVLLRAIKTAEETHPEWGSSTIVQEVAGGVGDGDVAHSVPMLSLDNALNVPELADWYRKTATAIAGEGNGLAVVVEPKFDGLALSLRYENGVLTQAVTRGNGYAGEDVTINVLKAGVGFPKVLPAGGIQALEVRGEALLTDAQFEAANVIRVAAGKAAFANARNAMGGNLRTIHNEPVPFTFQGYDIVGEVAGVSSGVDMLLFLKQLDFGISEYAVAETAGELVSVITEFERKRPTRGFGTDGAVVKVLDYGQRSIVGSGSRAPKWAIAFKFPPEEQSTTLLGIELGVGRSGALSLTGLLEPVTIAGSTVSRVTLHNVDDIARRDIRIGDRVMVIKSGDVIPRIQGVLTAHRTDETVSWEPPTSCPNCGGAWVKDDVVWRCEQMGECSLERVLAYAVSRDCFDMEGFGDKHVQTLLEDGYLRGLEGLFNLEYDIERLKELVGPKTADNIVAEMHKAKAAPLSVAFCALGIRMTGRRMSKYLSQAFGTIDGIMAASVEELANVDKIGPVKAAAIFNGIRSRQRIIEAWQKAGVQFTPEVTAEKVDGPLTGKKVMVTGNVPGYNREQAIALLEQLGGTVTSSVSKNLDILYIGEGAGGSKVTKAEGLGVTTQPVDALLGLVKAL